MTMKNVAGEELNEAQAKLVECYRTLAHVLMGALDEAAMVVARAEDPKAMRVEVAATLQTLLEGLRLQAPK